MIKFLNELRLKVKGYKILTLAFVGSVVAAFGLSPDESAAVTGATDDLLRAILVGINALIALARVYSNTKVGKSE